jgi:hypothetical protein
MAETHQYETLQERPIRPWQPRDPSIPFFPFSSLYHDYLNVAHPDSAHMTPFLLEPGLHSIEVYEAMLYKSPLGQIGVRKHLQGYVSRCRVSSWLDFQTNTKHS